ncbi:MAG: IS607 family transposase, partial [bacterium]
IMTLFSCKLQGKKANKGKQMIRELISDDNRSQSQVNS